VNFDGNHPLIAGALGAFLRIVHVRPRSPLEAACNLAVGSTFAWYGAPFLISFFPAALQSQPRAAGLAGLILGFLSMWLLTWLAGIVQKSKGNPFAAYRNLKKQAAQDDDSTRADRTRQSDPDPK